MFIDLLQSPIKRDVGLRELPPVPETGWRPPTYFPDLRGAYCIGVDLETKETDFDHGPGWARGEGHIIGVSVAVIMADGWRGKWYFPVRHEVERHDNLDASRVFGWLKDTLETTPTIPKIFANALYDCGWLTTENIYPVGKIYDVQFAEALIDEEALTALDALGHKYLQRGKLSDVCKEWVFKAYPGCNATNWRGNLWRTPPRLAGPYAEDDADMPLDILPQQWRIMESEDTLRLFDMECRGIPMLVQMRLQGVSVDIAAAEVLRADMAKETEALYAKLAYVSGVTITSVTAPSQLSKVFDAAGIAYLKSPTGKPSFRKEWLNQLGEVNDPLGVAKIVNDIREREKLCGTFIDSYILDRARRDGGAGHRGLVYCSFHPLRGDDGGAKTGRYASSDPNLQNIPSRTLLGKKVRGIFIPDYGHDCWHKKDHSQIEYRIFAHYAVGPRSDEIRYRYTNDPATDYHDDTMRDVAVMRGIDLAAMSKDEIGRFRKPIKNVNFGLLYGQTENSLAYKAGWSQDESRTFFAGYHAARPFVKTTMEAIQDEVQYRGYITTVLNRRVRFRRWEKLRYAKGEAKVSYTEEHATRLFGALKKRAFAYRGVNYRFQGSAADILKQGMLNCYDSGVFAYTGYPKLQVHDELDWSRRDRSAASDDAYAYVTNALEQAVKLRVPLKVDSSEGENWGMAA